MSRQAEQFWLIYTSGGLGYLLKNVFETVLAVFALALPRGGVLRSCEARDDLRTPWRRRGSQFPFFFFLLLLQSVIDVALIDAAGRVFLIRVLLFVAFYSV